MRFLGRGLPGECDGWRRPRSAHADQIVDDHRRVGKSQISQGAMRKCARQSGRRRFKQGNEFARWLGGQDGREKNPFSNSPLRQSDGLFPAHEHLTGTSTREADAPIVEVTFN